MMGDAAATALGLLDPKWVSSQFGEGGDPASFLSWTVAILLIGLCAGMAVRNWRLNRKVRSELGLKPGFERVNTVERLIEKADELAGRPTQEELDERDVTISSLERDLGARNHADAERAKLRETFLHKIDPDQQAAVVDAWLSPGRRLDVSARAIRGLGGGFSLDELLVKDGDGWACATDGAVSLLDSSGDLVALVMGRAARDDLSRTLREMDFYTKCTLVAVWRHNGLELAWLDPDGRCLNEDPPGLDDEKVIRVTNGRLRALMSLGLVEYETVSPSNRRWHLMGDVAELLAEPELVPEGAGETADEIWSSVEDAMSGS